MQTVHRPRVRVTRRRQERPRRLFPWYPRGSRPFLPGSARRGNYSIFAYSTIRTALTLSDASPQCPRAVLPPAADAIRVVPPRRQTADRTALSALSYGMVSPCGNFGRKPAHWISKTDG